MAQDDVFNESQDYSFDEQGFLREILEQPEHLTHEGENPLTIQGGVTSPTNSTVSFDEPISFCGNENDTLHKSNSRNSIKFLKKITCASPATTYLLSFDNSTAEPITHDQPSPKIIDSSNKRTTVKDVSEFEPLVPQPRKKVRRSSQTQHHIIAERKRRQELTSSIITLSATIPGLKKVSYVKI